LAIAEKNGLSWAANSSNSQSLAMVVKEVGGGANFGCESES
jgi:hypothetical protein